MDFENRYSSSPNTTQEEFLRTLERLEALEALMRAEAAIRNRRQRRAVHGEDISMDGAGNEAYPFNE